VCDHVVRWETVDLSHYVCHPPLRLALPLSQCSWTFGPVWLILISKTRSSIRRPGASLSRSRSRSRARHAKTIPIPESDSDSDSDPKHDPVPLNLDSSWISRPSGASARPRARPSSRPPVRPSQPCSLPLAPRSRSRLYLIPGLHTRAITQTSRSPAPLLPNNLLPPLPCFQTTRPPAPLLPRSLAPLAVLV
jgi:hypothetical protein